MQGEIVKKSGIPGKIFSCYYRRLTEYTKKVQRTLKMQDKKKTKKIQNTKYKIQKIKDKKPIVTWNIDYGEIRG
jgi:hypothetical protein